ncbi:hypothetical protein DRQ33_03230 [bacterium]|nr:MAG: hypothetical protein DRQ33_03230 [bacterium]
MKMQWKYITIFLMLCVFISCGADIFPRMPIIETFASSGCGACISFAQAMDTLYPQYVDSIVFVLYLSPFPADRFDHYSEYYDIGGVPWTALDGDDLDHYVASSVMAFATSRLHSRPISPIGFNLLYYDHDSISIDIYTDSVSYEGEWKLFGLIVKDSLLSGFNRVFQSFITAPAGTSIYITAGEHYYFSAFHELEPDADLELYSAVFFLQTPDSTEIINAFHTSMHPRLRFDFSIQQFACKYAIPPGIIFDVQFKIANWGICDDTYNISLSGDIPAGWEVYFPFTDYLTTAEIWVPAFGDTVLDIEVVASSVDIADIVLSANSDSIMGRIDTIRFEIITGGENLLVCDSPTQEDSVLYQNALDNLGIPYIYWDTERDGLLNDLTAPEFNNIIWFCGEDTLENIVGEERMAIQDFLNSGGNLLLSGSGIGRVNETAFIFFRDILGTRYDGIAENFSSVRGEGSYLFNGISGELGDVQSAEIFSGIDSTGGITIFTYPDETGAGVAKDDFANSIILGFPPERLQFEIFEEFIGNAVQFLCEGFSGIPTQSAEKPMSPAISVSPNPFNSICQISIAPTAIIKGEKLELYNITGEKVADFSIGSNCNSINWNSQGMTSGIYIVKYSDLEPVRVVLIK